MSERDPWCGTLAALAESELSTRALGVLCEYMGESRESVYAPGGNRVSLCAGINLTDLVAKLSSDKELFDLAHTYNCGKHTLAEIRRLLGGLINWRGSMDWYLSQLGDA